MVFKNIRTWLKDNGCNWNTNGTTPMTHTIMSGGVLYVPEDLYDEFLGVYGSEIKNGNTSLAYSEKKSADVFRMYFDLDILDHAEIIDDELLYIVKEVQRTVSLFFPGCCDDILKCVVSKTKPKSVDVSSSVKNDDTGETEKRVETFVKSGIHMNFPRMLVNLEMALQLRFSVVTDLEKKFGQRDIETNPWADVIDKAPYFNGLKMIGAVKSITCKKCTSSGKKKKNSGTSSSVEKDSIMKSIISLRRKYYKRDDELFDYGNIMTLEGDEFKNEELSKLYIQYQSIATICPFCNNKGWYLEDRFYSPSYIIARDGVICDDELEFIRRDFHEQMRITSIRARSTDEVTGSYTLPDGYLTATTDTATTCLNAFGSAGLEWVSPGMYRELVNGDVHEADAKGFSRWKGNTVTDPSILDMVTTCVRSFDVRYSNLVVKEVKEIKTGKPSNGKDGVISSGAAAGMSLNTKKTTKNVLSKLATSNNTVVQKDIILKVVTTIVVRIGGDGSTYCRNKGDKHTTNSVYFCINEAGITQKCFSRKDTIGISGTNCKNFKSVCKPIPLSLKRALFKEELLLDTDIVESGMNKRTLDPVSGKPKKMSKKNKEKIQLWGAMC